ncbi:efflux RND transporter periplasmic adaptor subunit [Pseudoalteromonas tunicata]|uniref:Heavy metal efflux system protein, putative n=1 Tax=Pseudoalteromonas tunicata D2 TaxID=87626 RepID=A4C7Q8_9GAMM|nr:efflux RND transporter periplasmic adaptor subunit [Pseudoalteromonas tunicata]ATC93129.1 Cu(I)/Ag(I) efflux system membrane protein CusB/SilB [Pseudoalteromonas tunicata]AXT32201.1 efflux RND transporter periplasmic adaptor subunit [Pseudoalteromonas tunicata]EAR28623.1 heavy metal efflux system protein, putative [Pseudoalteromonas tunicata D2]
MKNPFCLLWLLSLIFIFPIQAATPKVTSEKELITDLLSQNNQQRYVCPMHSHIVKDHPGKCPICGMDLVLVEPAEHQVDANNGVIVSGNMQQSMALTTARVVKSTLWRYIETFGSINYDQNGIYHVHPRAAGWVENLQVKTLGEEIKKGQLLYEIYSPDLVVAQDDYLSMFRDNQKAPNYLKLRGRTRLKLLGMTDALIEELEARKQSFFQVPYYAPFDSVVTELVIGEGMYVNPENRLMTLSDLSRVWVLADVFEHQMDWVKTGKWAEFDLPALGVYAAEGQIEYIYPALDPKTRTLKVRLALDNKDHRFKPAMIANVRIYGGPKEGALNIPVEALIRTEKQNRVIIKTSDNAFAAKEVSIGMITQGRAEVISGLSEGDIVVTSGQFLVDSEANIRSAILKMGAATSPMPSTHQH